ncbi:BON domain-containing protein [Actinoplanes subglobosus]|uniref:BON domain-containing protein n=1 Tax=Actinoplanes subglobosus TaxID=1547892 RepID=A0ABV8IQ52_9ACTN
MDDRWLNRRVRPAAGSDVELTCRVIERVLRDPRLSGECVTVEVQNRVVTLIGVVSSLYARTVAAELARSTPGVADICNRLTLARVSDAGDDLRHLEADPFDTIVAAWHTPQTGPPRPSAGMLRAAATLLALVGGILWLTLVPRHSGAALVVVVCMMSAAALAVLSTQPAGVRHR